MRIFKTSPRGTKTKTVAATGTFATQDSEDGFTVKVFVSNEGDNGQTILELHVDEIERLRACANASHMKARRRRTMRDEERMYGHR